MNSRIRSIYRNLQGVDCANTDLLVKFGETEILFEGTCQDIYGIYIPPINLYDSDLVIGDPEKRFYVKDGIYHRARYTYTISKKK